MKVSQYFVALVIIIFEDGYDLKIEIDKLSEKVKQLEEQLSQDLALTKFQLAAQIVHLSMFA